MSASPPCSPPRRPLHERSSSQTNSQNSRLQIRVVPYSPPRLSDVSANASANADADTSNLVSYADASTETDPGAHCSSPVARSSPCYDFELASLDKGKGLAPVTNLRRLSSRTSPTPTFDSWDFEPSHSVRDFHHHDEPPSSPPPSPRPPSRRKVISVHSDKTFSIHPQDPQDPQDSQDVSFSSKADSRRSRPSNTTRTSSYGGLSSLEFSFEDRPSSPLTPLTERSVSRISPAPSSEHESSSPWNYRMIGGLRKVRKTPDVKQKQPRASSGTLSELPLPPLPEITLPTLTFASTSQQITEKPSFQSSFSFQTDTTLSDKANYKVYGQSSPVNVAELDSLPPSSSHSNYHVLGPPSSTDASVNDFTRPQTGESEANYVVHRAASAASLVAVRRRLRPEFSRESLVVPPLRPGKRSSSENLYLYRSRSRDSIRTGSLTSLSTVLTQEATRAVFAGPATLLNQGPMRWQDSFGSSNPINVPAPMPEPRPHQWSCQLSTVMSESEGGSEVASRSLSPTSAAGRRGSAMSWQMLSMSSSLALTGLDDGFETPSHSRHGSVDRPQPVYNRTASRDPNNGIRLIRDQDEDGDGLADLEVLRHRPSRTRIGHYLASRSSDPNLRSGSSSRANSFNAGSIPAWARLYYGSGERKWLAAQASSDSMFSQFSESRGGSFLSRSSSRENHTHHIFNPRRRPRDPASARAQRSSNTGSMEMAPLPPHPVMAAVRNLKKQTSSIWSPHLGRDRRASGYGMWDPPNADWTATSELAGRRNAQIAMFVVGFIFPFAWMMASFFPLPSYSNYIMKHDGSPSNLDSRRDPTPSADEIVYHSVRWWRNVNRGMSIIGLLVLGAVIALIIVGVRQRWGS